ncbi:unnamed protein product [Effrenium voratum]|nr:unnamed protein product [Effrenium voratum]
MPLGYWALCKSCPLIFLSFLVARRGFKYARGERPQDDLNRFMSTLGTASTPELRKRVGEVCNESFLELRPIWVVMNEMVMAGFLLVMILTKTDQVPGDVWIVLGFTVYLEYSCYMPVSDFSVKRDSFVTFVLFAVWNYALPRQVLPAANLSKLLVQDCLPAGGWTLKMHFLLAPVYILTAWSKEPVQDQQAFSFVVLNEMVTLVALTMAHFKLQGCLAQQVAATLQAERSEHKALCLGDAAKRLLTVTCDACLSLSDQLHISAPSESFNHLVGGPSAGSFFLDYVMPVDRAKFQDFIEMGSHAPAGCHVRMKNTSSNTDFDAEIFHVNIGNQAMPEQHFIGISAQVPEPEASNVPDMRFLLGQGDSAHAIRAPSISTFMALAELESVQLQVDALATEQGFVMKSVGFNFSEEAKAENLPNLLEWVVPNFRVTVDTWVQHHANAQYSGKALEESLDKVRFFAPGEGCWEGSLHCCGCDADESLVIEELVSQALGLPAAAGAKKAPKREAPRPRSPGSPGSPPPLVPSARLVKAEEVPKGSPQERLVGSPAFGPLGRSTGFGHPLPGDTLARAEAESAKPEKASPAPRQPAAGQGKKEEPSAEEAEKAEKAGKKTNPSSKDRDKREESEAKSQVSTPRLQISEKSRKLAEKVKPFKERLEEVFEGHKKAKEAKAQGLVEEEVKEATPRLEISEHSRKLAGKVKPVHERLDDILKGREKTRAQARAKQEEMEMKDATLRPAISARAMKMERRFEDHQSWKEKRDKRIGEEQLAQYQKQLAECTFKPQINKISDTMARKTEAISFRSGKRPGGCAKACEGELPSESSPVSIDDCSWVSLLGEEVGPTAEAPVLDLSSFRRASDGDLFSKPRTPRPGKTARRPVSPRHAGSATPSTTVPDSPSAPLLRPNLDELDFARRASIPVLAPMDKSTRTPRSPRSASAGLARVQSQVVKKSSEEASMPKQPQWRPGGAAAKASPSPKPRSSLTSRSSTEAHVIPYCAEFQDVFNFTAQLCR